MALMQNAATPSGAFKYMPKEGGKDGSGRMPDTMFAGLKQQIDDRFRSGKNAGKPLVLEGGLDWVQFGFSPKDLETLEGQREAARTIALAFGVPPMILGIPGDNTYSNLQEANADFYRSTVLPMCADLYGTLTRWLAPAFGDADGVLLLTYDEDEIPALATERKAFWDRIEASTVLTTNEKREALGYSPLKVEEGADEHDKVMLASNLTPLGEQPNGNEMGGFGLDALGGPGPNPPPVNGKPVNGSAIQ
jgi:HK97 family phage portal protein